MSSRPAQPSQSPLLPYYIAVVAACSLAFGVLSWVHGRHPDLAPLLLLSAMGVLSFNLREPTVTSRIGFSFLSIILLTSGAILGPFGAWFVGAASEVIDRDRNVKWFQRVFNVAMTSIIGAVGACVYLVVGGAEDLERVTGFGELIMHVGVPLIVADVVPRVAAVVAEHPEAAALLVKTDPGAGSVTVSLIGDRRTATISATMARLTASSNAPCQVGRASSPAISNGT